MTRTGNVSRWSAMRRNFISALLRKCAAFFLESPAPCADVRSRAADGRFQRPNPHRHAGPPPAYWGAAAIPHAPRHPCSARRAASNRDFEKVLNAGNKLSAEPVYISTQMYGQRNKHDMEVETARAAALADKCQEDAR